MSSPKFALFYGREASYYYSGHKTELSTENVRNETIAASR